MPAASTDRTLWCLYCNYDLRGIRSPVCPECGYPCTSSWICRSRCAALPRWLYRHRKLSVRTGMLLLAALGAVLLLADQGMLLLAIASVVGVAYVVVAGG
jgi:hypothetical protein